jgi:hypothetical protein
MLEAGTTYYKLMIFDKQHRILSEQSVGAYNAAWVLKEDLAPNLDGCLFQIHKIEVLADEGGK